MYSFKNDTIWSYSTQLIFKAAVWMLKPKFAPDPLHFTIYISLNVATVCNTFLYLNIRKPITFQGINFYNAITKTCASHWRNQEMSEEFIKTFWTQSTSLMKYVYKISINICLHPCPSLSVIIVHFFYNPRNLYKTI